MHKSIFPALVVAATVSLSFAQDPNLHIYLAYGQSNMSGQADVTAADRAVPYLMDTNMIGSMENSVTDPPNGISHSLT